MSGQGIVARDDFKGLLSVGESIHIPQGAMYRLENPSLGALIIIEVQMGDCDYLDEGDIERLDDIYERRCN